MLQTLPKVSVRREGVPRPLLWKSSLSEMRAFRKNSCFPEIALCTPKDPPLGESYAGVSFTQKRWSTVTGQSSCVL